MASLFCDAPIAPSLFQDCLIEPEEARSILRPQRDERYGFGFTLSPYRGCAHACRYCYVREYPHAMHPPEAWGKWIAPKLNAPELLWSQRHRLHTATVFLSSATDPYQPIEREFRLTRACLKVLLEFTTTRVIVHTRSALVLQDLDLLREFGSRLSVGFSIPTDDDTVRQIVEPKAPPIPTRWAAVERLARAGIDVGLAVAPLMALENPQAFARRAASSGVGSAWVGRLRLLENDPFEGLLRTHGWERILDPDYAEEVRHALQREIPRGLRAAQPVPAAPHRPRPRAEGSQPSLF